MNGLGWVDGGISSAKGQAEKIEYVDLARVFDIKA